MATTCLEETASSAHKLVPNVPHTQHVKNVFLGNTDLTVNLRVAIVVWAVLVFHSVCSVYRDGTAQIVSYSVLSAV